MSWLPKFRKPRPGTLRAAESADADHLAAFVRTHSGVEAFVEPRTTVTDTTLLLVAGTGEWTRRRVAGHSAARSFANKHRVPLYDATLVGYPKRMREWNERRKAGDV